MSNSVNLYEFIGFIMFYIELHELVYTCIAFQLIVFLCSMFRVRLCVDI